MCGTAATDRSQDSSEVRVTAQQSANRSVVATTLVVFTAPLVGHYPRRPYAGGYLLLQLSGNRGFSPSRQPSYVQAPPALDVWRSACDGTQQNPRHVVRALQRGEVAGAGQGDALNVGHSVALGGPRPSSFRAPLRRGSRSC